MKAYTFTGSHACSGGRVAHFIMAIAHQKSIVGDIFSDFMKIHFQETFNHGKIPQDKSFLQDGCPVQNSKKERQALKTVGAIKFSIPPRSADFNPIENISNYFKIELRNQAFGKAINYETFEQLSVRVKHTLENTPPKYIVKTMESMPRRKLMVAKVKRAKNKVLQVKLRAKFDLYMFLLTKTVGLEIPGLDLGRNTLLILLILLCSVYRFT